MNILRIKNSIESLLEDLQERQDIEDLKVRYNLTNEEIEGYIEFFAENQVAPLSTIRGYYGTLQKRDN